MAAVLCVSTISVRDRNLRTDCLRTARYESEQLSVAVQDTLVCLEMPLFAFLHLYAFSRTSRLPSKSPLTPH